jgi:signal transduction histidine kinase
MATAATADRMASRLVAPRGVAWSGIALVALVAALASINTTAKFLVSEPPARWLALFFHDFAFHACVGVAILLAVVRARARFAGVGWRQYIACALAVVGATAVAVVLVEAIEAGSLSGLVGPGETIADAALSLGAELFRYAFVGLVITSAWLYLCADVERARAIEQCVVDAERMDRQTAEARLQMLEAQIEPHFLFNTLAHVRRLFETDPAAGAAMLHNLQAYLSIALPRMREPASTLAREVEHVTAYLGIQQIRLGSRLAYAIEVPAELGDAHMPPMMLLTLVENAVKHGLTPAPDGGRVEVRASSKAGRLRVEVIDTGGGFARSHGAGTGLANTRARLASTYGAGASLALSRNVPHGVVATLELPLERPESARHCA